MSDNQSHGCSDNSCSSYGSCDCDSNSCPSAQQGPTKEQLEQMELDKQLDQIKHKIVVLSGKGGVGKSTVAANLAVSLAMEGNRVGLLDVDIHGPSVPHLLGLQNHPVATHEERIVPIPLSENLKVMSIGFLLKQQDDAIIWRGPMKMGVIKQFLKDVEWGELDYLVIDSPPGTGDEPLSVVQLIPGIDGGVIVTTPQAVAIADVRKSVNFCHQINLPILGVVENMSGFVCPKCNEVTDIFKTDGGKVMSEDMKVNFLGKIPIDPQIPQACDEGTPFIFHYAKTETAKQFAGVIKKIEEALPQK